MSAPNATGTSPANFKSQMQLRTVRTAWCKSLKHLKTLPLHLLEKHFCYTYRLRSSLVKEPKKPKQPFGNSGTSNWILRISSPHIPSKPFLQIKYSPTKVHKPPHLSFHTHIHIRQDISSNLLLLTRSLAYSAGLLLFFKEVSEKEGQRAAYGANFEAPCGW